MWKTREGMGRMLETLADIWIGSCRVGCNKDVVLK